MTALARASALGLSAAALAAGLLIGAPSDASPLKSPTPLDSSRASELSDVGLRGEGYVVQTSADELLVGEEGFITVQIQAQEGFKVNDQYPHKIKFKDTPEGVSVPAMVKKDKGKFEGTKKFTFRVPVTASKAGIFKLSGKLKFSVCNDKSCLIQKKNIRVALNAR